MSIFIESIIHDKSNNVSAVLSMYASFNIVMTVKAKKKSTWNKGSTVLLLYGTSIVLDSSDIVRTYTLSPVYLSGFIK